MPIINGFKSACAASYCAFLGEIVKRNNIHSTSRKLHSLRRFKRRFRKPLTELQHDVNIRMFGSNFYHGSEYGRTGNLPLDEMTDEKATKLLRQCEFSVTIKDFDNKNHNPVHGFDSNIIASNKMVEDRRAQAKYHHDTNLGMLFGVFDGHGGSQCAQAVSDRLFLYVALSLLPHNHLQATLQDLDYHKSWPALLEWYKDSSSPRGTTLTPRQESHLRKYLQKRLSGEVNINSVEDALRHAFLTVDRNIMQDAVQQIDYAHKRHPHADLKAIDCAMSGTTGCIAYISQGSIHVANVGDSQAVLGSFDSQTPGRWNAKSLSKKHNSWNEAEVSRIRSEHEGESKTVIQNDRLLGSLSPLRAFGNARFKLPADVINTIAQMSADYDEDIGVGGDYRVPEQTSWVLPNYKTPPYLTAEPEIVHYNIQENDSFIVLATDGLWEVLHKSDVIQTIGEHMERIKKNNFDVDTDLVSKLDILYDDSSFFGYEDTNTATHAIRNCIGQTFDGPSRRQLRAMLSLPVEESRFYRDDVTVTVIKLKQDGII